MIGVELLRFADDEMTLVSSNVGIALDGTAFDAGYWWRNIREPVRFSAAVQAAAQAGARIFVEVGPRPTLLPHIGDCLEPLGLDAATVGVLFVLAWLGALAFGPDAYDTALALAGSPLGLFVGFGLTLVLFSFILNGARHTINDTGNGLTPKSADLLSHISAWGPIVLAVLFWVLLFATGRVAL